MSIISDFIAVHQQFRVLHWQTVSYAEHNAYGNIYSSLDNLIDAFMETFMGKYGRPALEGEEDGICFKNITEIDIEAFLEEVVQFLLSFNNSLNNNTDSDLINLRDEMLAEVNKLKYLLTLS
jgi:hypothetical protein